MHKDVEEESKRKEKGREGSGEKKGSSSRVAPVQGLPVRASFMGFNFQCVFTAPALTESSPEE